MNTIITSIAETIPARHEPSRSHIHLDPALVAVLGCGAGSLLALSAILAFAGDMDAPNFAIGGNTALVLFAALSMDRPYRRFWMPALLALISAGLTGLVLAFMPVLELSATQLGMARFGLEGMLIISQLAAMGLVAMGWATAGRSPKRMRASAICVGLLAAMHLAQATHGAIDVNAEAHWAQAIDLTFALWLVRTAFCLLRPRFRA